MRAWYYTCTLLIVLMLSFCVISVDASILGNRDTYVINYNTYSTNGSTLANASVNRTSIYTTDTYADTMSTEPTKDYTQDSFDIISFGNDTSVNFGGARFSIRWNDCVTPGNPYFCTLSFNADATNFIPVSAQSFQASDSMSVAGQPVCLQNGTHCLIPPIGTVNWTDANNTLWRLDGKNAPPTANWSMGGYGFTSVGSSDFHGDQFFEVTYPWQFQIWKDVLGTPMDIFTVLPSGVTVREQTTNYASVTMTEGYSIDFDDTTPALVGQVYGDNGLWRFSAAPNKRISIEGDTAVVGSVGAALTVSNPSNNYTQVWLDNSVDTAIAANMDTRGKLNATDIVIHSMMTDALALGCDHIRQDQTGLLVGGSCLDTYDIPDLSGFYLPLTLSGDTQVNVNGHALNFNIGLVGSSVGLVNTGGTTKLYGAGSNAQISFPAVTATLGNVNAGGTGRFSDTAYALIAGGTTTTGAQQSIANSATTGTILRSAGTSAVPTWSSAVYPSTTGANQVLYSTAANNIAGTLLLFNGSFMQMIGKTNSDAGIIFNSTSTFDAPYMITGSGASNLIFGFYGFNSGYANPLLQISNNSIVSFPNKNEVLNVDYTGGALSVAGSGGINDAGYLNVSNTGTFYNNLIVGQNVSFKRYYWNGYNNETQNFLNTANTQVVNLSIPHAESYDQYGINIINRTNITFEHTGDYQITFMPMFYQTSGTNKQVEFWLELNGTDVPFSNTRYTMLNGEYNAPSITWQLDINHPASDRVRILWYSDSTNTQILTIGGITAPTRPSIPGVILNIQKVSEIT